ncbi:hypothetical protein D3C75_1292230 [compost metagenome]
MKDEADAIITVSIPIAVLKVLCGFTVNDQISAIILIQTADDVQAGGFTRAAGTQDGHEFIFP